MLTENKSTRTEPGSLAYFFADDSVIDSLAAHFASTEAIVCTECGQPGSRPIGDPRTTCGSCTEKQYFRMLHSARTLAERAADEAWDGVWKRINFSYHSRNCHE